MMAVSLFTFRELLKELGVDDYGTYNVVGGVVILFSFLSNAMTQSNQRFLSYHLGRRDDATLGRVFSMIINVQVVICLLIVFLAETIGLWFINCKMNFESGSMVAVNWVYQFSILTFVIQILQIPYTSAIISYEKMSFFSYFSIAEALIKLGVVLSLELFSHNRLIIYSGLLMLSALLIFIVYFIYCSKAFKICSYRRLWDNALFTKLIGFSGWNMLGGLGNVAAGQGINMLFNIFCGVVVNAAMGVSQQVSAAVTALVGNMQVAFNPQIIKSYAVGDIQYFNSLIFRSSRLAFYLIAAIGLPIIVGMKTILSIWLVDIPEYAIQFTQLTIVFCMIDVISGPLWIANQASGKVRTYMIIISILILSNLPVAYIILKCGLSPVYVIAARCVINVLVLIFRLVYLKHSINFPSLNFIKVVILRAILYLTITIPLVIIVHNYYIGMSVSQQVLSIIYSLVLSTIVGFYILMLSSERRFLLEKTAQVICHFKNKQ